jgi:hypothetical protein
VKGSAYVTSEKKSENPILIVDKVGVIGDLLLEKFKDESLVVFVSQKKPSVSENVVHIPFTKKVPTVPDNTYSHIFVIDDGTKPTKDSLASFIRKAQNDKAVFLFAAHIQRINETFISELPDLYQKAKIAIFGDIFCREAIYDIGFIVNQFIYQARNYNKIDVAGDGVSLTYPVYLDDVVAEIFEVIFGQNETKQLFYLFPKHGVTLLTLAHMFQKVNPLLHLDFVKEKKAKQQNYIFSEKGTYLPDKDYPLEERLSKVDTKQVHLSEPAMPLENPGKEKKHVVLPFVWLIFCLAFFLCLPLFSTLGFSFLGLRALTATKTALEKGSVAGAEKSVIDAQNYFSLAQKTAVVLTAESGLIGKQDVFDKLNQDIDTGQNISTAGVYLLNAANSLRQVFSAGSNAPGNFTDASNYLKNALVIFEKEKAQGQNFSDLTEKIDPLINFAANTLSVWPDVLGFNGQKTYLILFQNNMELRPGGGFIGSYGLLTLDKGKVANFSIHDIYDADGQLKGHVEPPFAIRRYLPSVNLYMRDSNFDVDYINDAGIAARFLNIEENQQVNGVIGVDVSFVRNILSAMGQVYVPEYSENVDAGNLFQLTESQSEKNFFPGSTQKKDFLQALFSAMQENLVNNKNLSYLSLAKALGDSIVQKHILFAFDNSSLQNLFTVNGWSSSLWDDRQQDPSTIDDYFGINEANLGINKANYFIKRSVSQVINVDDNGNVSASITVAYKNTNVNGIWPGGLYKNYLRFILPQGSQITDIKINGQTQSTISAITDPQVYENKNFSPPNKLEIEKYDQNGKTIYGFLVTVPVNALQTVTFDYTLATQVLVSSPVLNYDLKLFKQPGTDEYPYDFSFTYPGSFRVVSTSLGTDDNGRVVYSGSLNQDKEVFINLAKK